MRRVSPPDNPAAEPACRTSRADGRKFIRAVPIGDLKVLDPIGTTAYITRNHDFMVNVIAARQTLTGIIPGPVLFYWNTDKV